MALQLPGLHGAATQLPHPLAELAYPPAAIENFGAQKLTQGRDRLLEEAVEVT